MSLCVCCLWIFCNSHNLDLKRKQDQNKICQYANSKMVLGNKTVKYWHELAQTMLAAMPSGAGWGEGRLQVPGPTWCSNCTCPTIYPWPCWNSWKRCNVMIDKNTYLFNQKLIHRTIFVDQSKFPLLLMKGRGGIQMYELLRLVS